eukprot:m.10378 g.10378  ORF g.10378 m.10378 type:complete len:141 (+) comp22248_c0_seq2:739-1161(+)
MANSQKVDLMNLGKHCNASSCHRLDFLPFECEKCGKTFCSDHRNADKHGCLSAEEGDARVPICPLCNQMIMKGRKDDVNVQVDRHIMSGCRDLVVQQKQRVRCAKKSCRQVEPFPFTCSKCGQRYCVRHRHHQDHACSVA